MQQTGKSDYSMYRRRYTKKFTFISLYGGGGGVNDRKKK